MELRPPRGTLDLLPPEGSRMRALYDRAAALAQRYGYRYVETPGFEATELFARTSGATSDVVSKEMYTFEDRRGRSLTLRPEGTAPVMRAYLATMQEHPSPFKAYYLTRMYRYARPQEGRYREHRQFGIEIFGAEEPAADVEVIVVADDFLRELGLARIELQLNSIGDETCRPAYRELLVAFLRERRDRLTDEHRDRFEDNPLRVLDCKDEACRAVAAEAPRIIDHLCDACREHFDGVLAGLKDAGLSPLVAPTLVRGLDYYTRTVFEFESERLGAQAALGGGGRYDRLVEELGGPPTPGVGWAAGIERILLASRDEPEPQSGVYIALAKPGLADDALALARGLRDQGIRAEFEQAGRSLRGQLKQADRVGARMTVILGDSVDVRDMHSGDQRQAADLDEAAAMVKAAMP
jgi:histidyl-tRNA synthetase